MKVFLPIVAILLGIVFIAQVVFAIAHNRNLEKGFVKGDNVYAYDDALENGTVDLDQIRNLFPSAIAMINLNQENTISSPREIRYYENISDALPVYVIEKGQSINVRRGSSLMDNVGYGKPEGIQSVPCYGSAASVVSNNNKKQAYLPK